MAVLLFDGVSPQAQPKLGLLRTAQSYRFCDVRLVMSATRTQLSTPSEASHKEHTTQRGYPFDWHIGRSTARRLSIRAAHFRNPGAEWREKLSPIPCIGSIEAACHAQCQ